MNVVADALSRKPHLNVITTLTASLADNETFEQGYPQDKYFADILQALKYPEQADEKARDCAKHFEWKDKRLYLKNGNRLAIPANRRLRTHILQENYDIGIAGHLGISKTIDVVMRNFY